MDGATNTAPQTLGVSASASDPTGPADCRGRVEQLLSSEVTDRLQQLSRREGVSFLATLLGAWAMLIARWSRHNEVVISVRVPNARDHLRLGAAFEYGADVRIAIADRATVHDVLWLADNELRKPDVLRTGQNESQTRQLYPQCIQSHIEFAIAEPQSDERGPYRDLDVSLVASALGVDSTVRYDCSRFEHGTVERLTGCWRALLEEIATDPCREVGRLPMLTQAERETIVHRLNDTTAYRDERLIHEIFEAQVETSPQAKAVVYEGLSFTYSELNARANRLARLLLRHGIRPDCPVALCVERGLEMVVGVLAILKAGGAYLPLDPLSPAQRLSYMIGDAGARVVLTQARFVAAFPAEVTCIPIDDGTPQIDNWDGSNLDARSLGHTARQLAYVIYTSGSTGEPKGVMVEHASAVNFWHVMRRTTHLDCLPGSRIGLNATYTFDMSLKGLLQLLSGHCVVVVPQAIRTDGHAMVRFMCAERIDAFDSTPSQLDILLRAGLLEECGERLKSVLLGGEPISSAMWEVLRHSRRIHFFNMYGPTECTVDATIGSIRDASGVPNIGRPIANARIYILDQHLQPVPRGVVGEIYIGGAGIARGYLKRPELTAGRFLCDPFSTAANARMYKTGDLGRWRQDGTIEYVGRNDHQVKIRGYRFELGEVEEHIARHPKVSAAVVVALQDATGEKRAVAYIVPQRAEGVGGPLGISELRGHLLRALPEYMVPAAFVFLQALPLTRNGKVDRGALLAPGPDAHSTYAYSAPEGAAEEAVASAWSEILGIARVGRRDHFFELGGHSLLIARMLDRLGRDGFSAHVHDVYTHPSLAEFAQTLKQNAEITEIPPNLIPSASDVITPQMVTLADLTEHEIQHIVRAVPGGVKNIQDVYPLAPLQEGILFHHLMDQSQGDPYVLPMLIALPSRQALDELVSAMNELIARHDVLRTAVLWEQLMRPLQVVYRHADLPVEELVLSGCGDPIERLSARMAPEHQHMRLHHAPLIRMQIAADPVGMNWYALVQLHHIISDHESRGILLSELTACIEGRAHELAPPAAYRAHVGRALARAKVHDSEAFFRAKLGDVEEPTAPFDLLDTRGAGARVEESRRALDFGLGEQVRALGRRLGVSPAALFHAAWALVVSRTSGRDDVVFGTVLSGRLDHNTGAQPALGMFLNTLPIRLRLEAASAETLVHKTHQELAELLDHQHASLAGAQRCSGIKGEVALFSTLLNYLHQSARLARIESGDIGRARLLAFREWTSYPIVMSVEDQGTQFLLTAQTDRSIDPSRIIAFLETAVRELSAALQSAPHTPIARLSILPEHELRQLTGTFNATQAPFPRDKPIHELFAVQAHARPEAVAVLYQDVSLTYAELNAQANQVARYLQCQNVRVGDHVAVVISRSLTLLVVQLAVLKCGAVYVPVDSSLPVERAAFIVRDCGARVVIAEGNDAAWSTETAVPCIEAKRALSASERLSAADLHVVVPGTHSAYVMYTSGSTGRPKGVAVPHRGVSRLVMNNGYAQFSNADCFAHTSNPAFDASTFEVWGALLHGARLLIVPRDIVLDVRAFQASLQKHRVTVLFLTVGLFAQYAGQLREAFRELRYLITGGDVLDAAVVRRVLEASAPKNLLNAYGPTECTAFATVHRIQHLSKDTRNIPIGRPISNTQVYILDGRLQPVPIGVSGEIYLGGPGVAVGYLNRPKLTAERFIPDSFGDEPGARLYRTGDLGRWTSNGNIEFLGRYDQQVKLRGFRIELGEIESHLIEHSGIGEAAVIARDEGTTGKRLVAYVTKSPGHAPDVEALRLHLAARLPEYMIPSAFVILEQLPLNPNGKVDRRALPVPDRDAFVSRQQGAPPLEGTETRLASLWQSLLRVEKVGRDDNFFEMGGHSLLAMQLSIRLSAEFGADIRISVVFDSPVLSELATRVDELRRERLLQRISDGGQDLEAMLAQVAAMPESAVQERMRELKMEGRS